MQKESRKAKLYGDFLTAIIVMLLGAAVIKSIFISLKILEVIQ